jgi:hypothetical protein
MKTKICAVMLTVAGALAMSTSAHAVTLSGGGCNVSGTASYLYVNPGTSLVLVNGLACFISGLTAGEVAALSAVVSQAQTTGKKVAIGTGASLGGGTPTALSVVMQ